MLSVVVPTFNEGKNIRNLVTQINDALEANTPNFSVDLTTGHLMWQGGRFNFQVDNSTGHLGWEVSA